MSTQQLPARREAGSRNGTGLGDFVGLLGGIAGRAASGVVERITPSTPSADLDARDPDYIRENLAGLWLLASLYFRADVRGLDRIPATGPVLIVGNHSGGNMTPDTLVFTLAFSTYFGVERRFYQLAHNLVVSMPHLSFLRKYGTVGASRDNARCALDEGAAVLVYPGGDHEVHRPSWETGKVDFGGRKGFVRLAMEMDVPIVPLVALGGQETALFITRGRRLARLLRLDSTVRLKVLPVSLALPWGINVGDMLGHLPLPAKLRLEALEPIHLREEFGEDADVDEVYRELIARMQAALDRLKAERRLPFVG